MNVVTSEAVNPIEAETVPRGPTLSRYRLDSGKIAVIGGEDIDSHGIEIVQPLLSQGRHRVPNAESWMVETVVAGSMLIATVDNGNGPILRMSVVVEGNDLARVVPPPRVLDLPVPACIVETRKELPYDPVVGWLRSLVETLAWAWLIHARETGLTPRCPQGPGTEVTDLASSR